MHNSDRLHTVVWTSGHGWGNSSVSPIHMFFPQTSCWLFSSPFCAAWRAWQIFQGIGFGLIGNSLNRIIWERNGCVQRGPFIYCCSKDSWLEKEKDDTDDHPSWVSSCGGGRASIEPKAPRKAPWTCNWKSWLLLHIVYSSIFGCAGC